MQIRSLRRPIPLALLSALVLAADLGSAATTTLYFRAAPVTNTMPDGRSVVMWGFARDTGPATADGLVQVPGPSIFLPSNNNQNLVIQLTNTLPEPVSIVIPGQLGSLGDPARNADGRVRSFTHETPPGGSALYSWTNVAPGTFLYHSGSHPAVQVQMGLYGALIRSNSNGRAYPNAAPHDAEVTLLLSEIDPALHDAVASNGFGPGFAMSSTLRYQPQYFLINGACYTNGLQTNGLAHALMGSIPHSGGSRRALLRFLNAGLDYHAPVLGSYSVDVFAEDGKLLPASRSLCSLFLPPLKTMDAFLTLTDTNVGTVPLFDRRLGLVNGANGSPGGMISYLAVSKTRSRHRRHQHSEQRNRQHQPNLALLPWAPGCRQQSHCLAP